MYTGFKNFLNAPTPAEMERSKYSKNEIYYDVVQPRKLSYTDSSGYYRIIIKDHIHFRYEPTMKMGIGSFGEVVEAIDHKRHSSVAIKIMRTNTGRNYEKEILNNVYMQTYYRFIPIHAVARFFNTFSFRGHQCIVFERLYCDLTQVLPVNPDGLPVSMVRDIIHSTLYGLLQIHDAGMVHNDIKSANILLREPLKPFVKIIDFGSADVGMIQEYRGPIQTSFYRAPEVILQLPHGPAADIWSLACVAAEMCLGGCIFRGAHDDAQLGRIMQVLGLPPRKLLKKSPVLAKYFITEEHPLYSESSETYQLLPQYIEYLGKRQPLTRNFAFILSSDDPNFFDFMSKCLTWQPEDRLDVRGALNHPWISGYTASDPEPVRFTKIKRQRNLPNHKSA